VPAVAFARRVFTIAGIYGLIVMLPQYFLEDMTGRLYPPAITHPEYYYGFIGVVVAWQVAFLIIGRDPIRYRPLMIPSILEKAGFAFAAIPLYLLGRLSVQLLGAALIDMTLGVLFVISYIRTGSPAHPGRA
jgi:hypothetical protein